MDVTRAYVDDLVVRGREFAELLEELALARTGGRGVLVEGEPGAGTSFLVDRVLEHAPALGLRPMTCRARPAGPPWSAVHELVRPVLDDVPALPPRQRDALLAAFGHGGEAVADPFVAGLGVLGLLQRAASPQPVLVVVEGVQELDDRSLGVLGVVAAGLREAGRVLATARSGPGRSGIELTAASLGLPRLELAPLPGPEAAALLDDLGAALCPDGREQVLREAGGNPLALREFAVAVAASGPIRGASLRPALGVSERLRHAFGDALTGLGTATRRLLNVVAAEPDALSVPELVGAAEALSLRPADLDAALRRGVVEVREGAVRFRRPYLRSLVYSDASPAERAEAHLALATVVHEHGRAVLHRAEGTLGRDAGVADELEAAVGAPGAAPVHALGARILRRAADLTPDSSARARRLAAAAEVSRRAGLGLQAQPLLREALPLAAGATVVGQLAVTQNVLGLTADAQPLDAEQAVALCRRIEASAGVPADEARLAQLVVLSSTAVVMYVRAAPEPLRRRVIEVLGPLSGPAEPLWVSAMTLLDPLGQGARLRPLLPVAARRLASRPLALYGLALAAEAVADLATSAHCWRMIAALLQGTGSVPELAGARTRAARLDAVTGTTAVPLERVLDAEALATRAGAPAVAALAAATQARLHALRGETVQVAATAERSRDLAGADASPGTIADQSWALGLDALARRRHGDAHAALTGVKAHPTVALWALGDVVEAAVGVGDTGAGAAAVDLARPAVAALGSAHLALLVARALALLAKANDAGDHFAAAVDAGSTAGVPLELARTHLLHGEWLRRERRITQARTALADALAVFTALGAQPWRERAARELRAAGGAQAKPSAPGQGGNLTAQELVIARLAAAGLTNKEIGVELHLSPRTVGAHLYRLFPKVGVSHRRQLARLDLG